MKQKKFMLLSILSLFLVFNSCKKDGTAINESNVLATYLESTNSPLMKDFVNTDMPTLMEASEVKTLNETGQVYIIDVRSATDFAKGHIANAHNVTLRDILTHIEALDLTSFTKVAIVCCTGQSSGFTASLLRMMGYDKVYSMKWGLSAWNKDLADEKWTAVVANGNAYATQFTSDATDKGAVGNLPVLSTGKSTGQEILKTRMNTVLLEGFPSISKYALFENLAGYYIVNYWPDNHYTNPGHITGAIQYTPKEAMKLAADLKTLPTDRPVVVYCYTGQTSAYLTAYLCLLGYDARSLLYGANGMCYDKMVGAGITTVFNDSQIMDYDYEMN